MLKIQTQGRVLCAVVVLMAGCQTSAWNQRSGMTSLSQDNTVPHLKETQVADVQSAMGRTMENDGRDAEAEKAYLEALKHDPERSDVAHRLAILKARQGRFKEAEDYLAKALAAHPGDATIFADMGYTLYLEGRWSEAEMNLRQSLTLNPDDLRGHNNLGLVLAHLAKMDAAAAEFRRAGCTQAQVHINLAFVLTLEKHWPDAKAQYEAALALEPNSVPARKGLRELDRLVARNSLKQKTDGASVVPVSVRN
jgi:Tfp pilus assembly protein PilF